MTKTMSLMTSPREFALQYWPAIALLIVLVLALVGYSAWSHMTATNSTMATASTAGTASTTGTTPGWSRVCVAGVSYVQFKSGASVEWTPAGKVKTCSEAGK
jgi:hypothetical protein